MPPQVERVLGSVVARYPLFAFGHNRRVNKDGTVDDIMRAQDVRIFAAKREDGKNGIRAVPIPPSIRSLCE